MLEDVCDPFGIPLVCFLTPNGFHILRVSKDNTAGGFQNVVNGNPIFPSGFHTHILAVVLRKPSCTPPQIPGKGRKPLAFVGCHALLIGRSDTDNNKGLVDIHSATDAVNDFEHNTSPQNSI